MSAAKKAKKTKVAETTKASDGKLKNKNYEQELAKLHVELVKLQQWVVHAGLKVCIVFEGRDGAGKGGVIKAITERVSPRVFRVVALPAPPRVAATMTLQSNASEGSNDSRMPALNMPHVVWSWREHWSVASRGRLFVKYWQQTPVQQSRSPCLAQRVNAQPHAACRPNRRRIGGQRHL